MQPSSLVTALAASALVLGTACGDDDAPPIDAAGPPDAAAAVIDAPPPDAPVDAGPPDAHPIDAAPAPDLIVNAGRALVDLALIERSFDEDACVLDPEEDCVGGPGLRRLLRFSTETPNIGTADMFLGVPVDGNPQFQYSTCHEHFHFLGYADYQLLDGTGAAVAAGHKQAFCLLDSSRYLTDDPTVSGSSQYNCAYQGIQRGWSDVYEARLDCQWIDVTDVPDGEYQLQISINNGGTLPELRYDNNVVTVPVRLGDPALTGPTEPCPDGLDRHTTDGMHRECGWEHEGTFACTPNQLIRVGCAANCSGLGSCTGDPIMRVCDHARPDGNCSVTTAVGSSDDACASQCPRVNNLRCPASGQVDVYSAPFTVGDAYTCEVELD